PTVGRTSARQGILTAVISAVALVAGGALVNQCWGTKETSSRQLSLSVRGGPEAAVLPRKSETMPKVPDRLIAHAPPSTAWPWLGPPRGPSSRAADAGKTPS